MTSKNVVMLSQQLYCIIQCVHQYNVHIQWTLGPKFLIADWLWCHNHMEDQGWEITDMNADIHTISTSVDVPICTCVKDLKVATEDVELQVLKRYIIGGWPDSKEAVEPGAEKFWPIRHEFAMINGIVMKGKHITIPCPLQKQILE